MRYYYRLIVHNSRYVHKKAIIVKRVDKGKNISTKEIKNLAVSAGFNVVETLEQKREEDKKYNIGEGKLHSVQLSANKHNADAIIFDNELGPYQMYNIGIYLSDDIDVYDKYTLVLDIFEQRSTDKKSQLQVELAQLRYELPRAETKVRLAKRSEHPGFMGLGEYEESREKDIKDRIKNIKSQLTKYEDQNSRRRTKRRKDGFDLVAIAGYTNAGKSTLLRKLARDHSVDENRELHEDFSPTAESTDNYFTTLDTITRSMDFEKRDVLLTDTIGFISNLPNWLVNAFNTTLDNIYNADLVLVVADATRDTQDMIDRISTCYDIISENKTTRTITVFNKSDQVSESELERKKQELEALAPNPIAISAKKNENIDKLKNRIHRALPPFEEDRLLLPMNDESMSLVSWVHNNAYVDSCEYTTSNVILTYRGRDDIIKKIRNKAEEVTR